MCKHNINKNKNLAVRKVVNFKFSVPIWPAWNYLASGQYYFIYFKPEKCTQTRQKFKPIMEVDGQWARGWA